MTLFIEWLRNQKDLDDPVGKFARLMIHEETNHGPYRDLRHLRFDMDVRGASPEIFEALKEAERRFVEPH